MECYSGVEALHVYPEGLIIEKLTDGQYQMIIGNETYHGLQLADYEKRLHEFYISQSTI